MGKRNQELIEKALSTDSLLNGGALNPEQQTEFVRLTRSYSTLLSKVRFVPMNNPTETIDKMHIGEPVTEAASEDTDTGNQAAAKFNKISMTAFKLRTAWNITTETLQLNIERGNLEGSVFESMTERMSTDFELVAISGDQTTVGTTPNARLLKAIDGWDLRTEEAHILDVGGASIEKGIWSAARDRLPKQYRNDPGLRFICSDSIATDWNDYLSDRGTPGGDAAIGGQRTDPQGIPLLLVPLIPDDLAVAVAGANHATVIGTQQGPFEITTGVNDKFKIDVDDAGVQTVTIAQGTYEAVRLCAKINAAVGAVVASDDAFGRIKLKSTTTGVGSEIDIQAVANDCYTTLGFTVASTDGLAAAGQELDGTFIWLCNPQNLIFGMLNETRVYSEFNKDFDRVESRVYNHICTQVENIDAIVKIKGLRRRTLFA